MTRFVLVRHAMTQASGRRLVGRAPGVPLNEQGRRQARALAERLSGLPVASIYSSPLERAVETAESIAQVFGLTVITSDDFLEIDFGQWTGRTFQALDDDPGFRRFNAFRSGAAVPGGERMLHAQARMIAGLDRLRSHHPHDTVAVVGHGDLIKAAVAHYAGIPLDMFQRIQIGLASVSVIDVDDEGVRIVTVNDTGAAG